MMFYGNWFGKFYGASGTFLAQLMLAVMPKFKVKIIMTILKKFYFFLFLILNIFSTTICYSSNLDFFQIRLVDETHKSDSLKFKIRSSIDSIKVDNKILINLSRIEQFTVVEADNGSYMIVAILTKVGKQILSRITGAYIAQKLCVIIDNEVVYIGQIMSKLRTNKFIIATNLSKEDANMIANNLINRLEK